MSSITEGKEMDNNTFEVDGTKFLVNLPSVEDVREADKVYNRKMADCLKAGAMIRVQAEDFIKRQNIWNEEKESEVKALQKQVVDLELILTVKGRH